MVWSCKSQIIERSKAVIIVGNTAIKQVGETLLKLIGLKDWHREAGNKVVSAMSILHFRFFLISHNIVVLIEL